MLKAIRQELRRRRDPVGYARSLGVTVGERCRLIDVSFSSEPYLVTLGNHVSATATRFETHDGGVWVFRDEDAEIDVVRPITVGDNVFIGYGTIILPGVTIGDNVVIGAGSIVTKDIPSGSVAAGVPCRVIRPISEYRAGLARWSEPTKELSRTEKRAFYLRKFHLARS
ncbi:DapH/DapD/GlmU-related protein [Sphingomonas desiccabilis]|uniref:Acetyltransferase n=1 Tax=Sphingomonas desiccabilis TaxID=429134 RepID=A0A4Q2IVS6_9SPHN|nr:DapH/DapD/GlmU-related protein [Sphingomonas desiccabilis]MBB3912711.1 acetyltransferase-like isoleucine patch superfamily enzyme [Sphingomonas desiccabilis]RXZ34675.1 capsule biosynthesis protein CapG [Sphingomonas desiccabilis]